MTEHPTIPVKVLILWAPYLKRDSQSNAVKATRYLTDKRVQHFWDVWRFGTRIYSEQFDCEPQKTWNIYVVYKPELTWSEAAPPAMLWLHNQKLETGTRYSKETLEAGLLEWSK